MNNIEWIIVCHEVSSIFDPMTAGFAPSNTNYSILSGFPQSQRINPVDGSYVCYDCGLSKELKWRYPNGDLLPLNWWKSSKHVNLCNSCAKYRQENTVTPCMKL